MTSCCAPEALAVWWLDSFRKIRAFLDDTRQLLSMWFQGEEEAGPPLLTRFPGALSQASPAVTGEPDGPW